MGTTTKDKKHVLITGASGALGRLARQALEEHGGITITGCGRDKTQDVVADLSHYDSDWAQAFAGVDVVLHLAADPSANIEWPVAQRANIDLSLNVLAAARQHQVKRFVFASSNWVLAGHRFGSCRLNATTPPYPVNPYGAAKLFIERLGLAMAAEKNPSMDFLVLRIGYCQHGENQPGPQMSQGWWGQQMWLSNPDWQQAVIKSCCHPFSGSAVINVVSNNVGMRWDLDEAKAAIDYQPVSTHVPRLGLGGRGLDSWVRFKYALLPPRGKQEQ